MGERGSSRISRIIANCSSHCALTPAVALAPLAAEPNAPVAEELRVRCACGELAFQPVLRHPAHTLNVWSKRSRECMSRVTRRCFQRSHAQCVNHCNCVNLRHTGNTVLRHTRTSWALHGALQRNTISGMQPALLFDLDGTLVDSIELILASARHAFVGFVGQAPTDAEWRATIGRPLEAVLREYAHHDETETQRLFGRYREHQLAHHDRLVRAYDGVVATLRALAGAGHPMALVTSKSDWLARRGLELVGVNDLFAALVGCDSCVNHKPHPEPVERALALLGVPPSESIFIGDSPHDVESGRAAHVYTVGVTWGAFAREQMDACGADVVIHDIAELPGVIDRFTRSRSPLQTF